MMLLKLPKNYNSEINSCYLQSTGQESNHGKAMEKIYLGWPARVVTPSVEVFLAWGTQTELRGHHSNCRTYDASEQ